MHETDMTKALIHTIRDWWEVEGRPHIETLHLVVGDFTCVEPESLQFAFAAHTRGTFLDRASLAIRTTPLIAFCHSCQAEYEPEIGRHYECPMCNAPMDDIRSGRELKIERVEYTALAVGRAAG
ncbi:hydrogenase nickel insertion protein HypA [Rubidibacter lacunae KORDI 51-2]|uniref:Hydrogenase maturation factor HypA n=1 Tax=Rubidibacter lacunae KORDI 51-2 TaxID=582515 RepID=U5DHM3_9CHRO|nr:hydrogenase maturation nickel metallochaperone HypA [Rubidibacter lacunae]ERN41121.1 hydrogenase nickel insertion protein HypA [Rubidibacter lacunae KORDI 51-2]